MGYRSLRDCVDDLQRSGQLVTINEEIDPCLEAAEIQRRVYQAGGPAIFYPRVKGCRFPMVSNLFGTLDRARFLFRDTLDRVRRLIELKIDPTAALKRPWRYWRSPFTALTMLPRAVRRGPILGGATTLAELPQLKSWPDDGGAFITLPEVYTEDPDRPGLMNSNLGMYRVQFSGGRYQPNEEAGMHYQIHRGIGVHHAKAIRRDEPLKVNVFVGGSPAMMVSAVMPLPEGLSELTFAGALSGRRIRMVRQNGRPAVYADADFCLCGTIDPRRQLPEGPFGDHLGYYSLAHDFPVMKVDRVLHRRDAIWPFTTVGRPPQEDTTFGELIHELTGPVIPTVLPGVRAVHAVDAAGVHPLLLAIGSERYVPYASVRKPQELLTQANAILGQGQLSLAKYLFLAAEEDDPTLDIHDVPAFFQHVLRRLDPTTDLHFQTRTTIDTLDYSGTGFNAGSKLVIAVAGPPRRELPSEVPSDMKLPEGFSRPRVCFPGVLAIQAPPFSLSGDADPHPDLTRLCAHWERQQTGKEFPLVVLVDDSRFTAETLNNFVWTVFSRSNPACDVWGVGGRIRKKHFECLGAVVIDARRKPHHAPPLIEDPQVTRRVNELAAPGKPLHGIL